MKKITLISLIGPALLIILRLVDIIKKMSILGFGNNYSCDMSTHAKCSLPYYMFKSDDAIISYIGIVLSFVFLFALTSYILFLIRLYKKNRFNLFWILIFFTILVLITCPFIVNYLQLIG